MGNMIINIYETGLEKMRLDLQNCDQRNTILFLYLRLCDLRAGPESWCLQFNVTTKY